MDQGADGAAQRVRRTAAAAQRASDAADDAREVLYMALYDGEQSGISYGELAKVAGLSKAHVHRVCLREGVRRQAVQIVE